MLFSVGRGRLCGARRPPASRARGGIFTAAEARGLAWVVRRRARPRPFWVGYEYRKGLAWKAAAGASCGRRGGALVPRPLLRHLSGHRPRAVLRLCQDRQVLPRRPPSGPRRLSLHLRPRPCDGLRLPSCPCSRRRNCSKQAFGESKPRVPPLLPAPERGDERPSSAGARLCLPRRRTLSHAHARLALSPLSAMRLPTLRCSSCGPKADQREARHEAPLKARRPQARPPFWAARSSLPSSPTTSGSSTSRRRPSSWRRASTGTEAGYELTAQISVPKGGETAGGTASVELTGKGRDRRGLPHA